MSKKKKDLVCELLNAPLVFTDSLHCLAAFLLLRLHLAFKLPHLKRCKNNFLQRLWSTTNFKAAYIKYKHLLQF